MEHEGNTSGDGEAGELRPDAGGDLRRRNTQFPPPTGTPRAATPEVVVDEGKEQAAGGREVEVWLVSPREEFERCGRCCTAALYFTQGRRVTAWTLPANKAAYQSSALMNEPPGKNRPSDKQAGSTRGAAAVALAALSPYYQPAYLRQHMTATRARVYFGHRLTWDGSVA